jgi:hypothetical protein
MIQTGNGLILSKAKQVLQTVEVFTRNNSSKILTGSGVVGLAGTTYFAVRGTVKMMRDVFDQEIREHRPLSAKEIAKTYWKYHIPTGLTAAATTLAIVGSNRINSRRTAALTAAYSLTEKAFAEYKEKVVETLGDKKEKKLRDEIAQDRVNGTSLGNTVVIGGDNVLCYEMHTGRYFQGDIELIRKAQNAINAQLISQMEATVSDFYYLIGLPQTSSSSYSGWSSDRMLDISFTSLLNEGRPCLAFEYNYVKVF